MRELAHLDWPFLEERHRRLAHDLHPTELERGGLGTYLAAARFERNVDFDWGDAEFDAAIEILDEQVASGQIRNIKGNSYLEDLRTGNAIAAIAWSGIAGFC